MKSMTGFGRAKLEKDNRIYGMEIKSVNHKYSDITIKLPRNLSYLEEKIKKEISKSISRGKIDVFITFENYSDEGKDIVINHELVKKYMEEFTKLSEENNLNLHVPVTEITKLPDVLTIKTVEDKEDVIEHEVMECVAQAISNFIGMREQEGSRIKEDLEQRVEALNSNIEKFSVYSTGLVEEYVVKLKERIKEILQTDILDEARLGAEVVIYADKCSIEEEITRLRSHVIQLQQLLVEEKPVGKKLDFLIQEMNRETNTIGSKSASLAITNLVVDVKTQLEDIREQIQNIE
ncbi:MAG: YicC/YloC family endoribonuclease [Clostridia bacterium]